MKLVRYENPEFALANSYENWFRKMFRDFGSFGNTLGGPLNSMANSADVGLHADLYEADDAYHAAFALPGLTKKDINVELVNSVLTVRGEFSDHHGESERKMAFSRSLAVPEGVEAEDISATMKDGMLYLTLPKAEEKKPVSIKIK